LIWIKLIAIGVPLRTRGQVKYPIAVRFFHAGFPRARVWIVKGPLQDWGRGSITSIHQRRILPQTVHDPERGHDRRSGERQLCRKPGTLAFVKKFPDMTEQDYTKSVMASLAHGGHHQPTPATI
jgi:hypothetical protein